MTTKEIILKGIPESEFSLATRFVQLANRFRSQITVTLGDKTVSAKSLISMLKLSITENDCVTVKCHGHDEAAAMDEIIIAFGKK